MPDDVLSAKRESCINRWEKSWQQILVPTLCKFIIRINGTDDTIEFRYSGYLHLISKECGYTWYYNLDTALHSFNIIDSLSFSKKTITTLSEENIQIYY